MVRYTGIPDLGTAIASQLHTAYDADPPALLRPSQASFASMELHCINELWVPHGTVSAVAWCEAGFIVSASAEDIPATAGKPAVTGSVTLRYSHCIRTVLALLTPTPTPPIGSGIRCRGNA